MLWIALAASLAILVTIFRIGVGALLVRWLKEDGQPDVARLFRAFLITLWSGVAIGIVGAFANVKALKYLGFVIFASALVIQFWMGWTSYRAGRQRSRK